jgi:hypothetical protein
VKNVRGGGSVRDEFMPSLIRFLVICAIIAGGIYGGMVALATMVEPNQREMTVRIPPAKLKPQ